MTFPTAIALMDHAEIKTHPVFTIYDRHKKGEHIPNQHWQAALDTLSKADFHRHVVGSICRFEPPNHIRDHAIDADQWHSLDFPQTKKGYQNALAEACRIYSWAHDQDLIDNPPER